MLVLLIELMVLSGSLFLCLTSMFLPQTTYADGTVCYASCGSFTVKNTKEPSPYNRNHVFDLGMRHAHAAKYVRTPGRAHVGKTRCACAV